MNNKITKQGTVNSYSLIIRTTIKIPIEVEIIPFDIINRKSATSKNAAICLMLIIMRRQPNAAITSLNLRTVSFVIYSYLNPPSNWMLLPALAPIELLTRLIIPPTENITVIPITPQSICCFPSLPSPPPCKSTMNWNKPHMKSNIAAANNNVMNGSIITSTNLMSTPSMAMVA